MNNVCLWHSTTAQWWRISRRWRLRVGVWQEIQNTRVKNPDQEKNLIPDITPWWVICRFRIRHDKIYGPKWFLKYIAIYIQWDPTKLWKRKTTEKCKEHWTNKLRSISLNKLILKHFSLWLNTWHTFYLSISQFYVSHCISHRMKIDEKPRFYLDRVTSMLVSGIKHHFETSKQQKRAIISFNYKI